MKLQFNLLPDVKQEYLKTQRTKRTVIAAAFTAAAISLFILLLMITTVYVINNKQLKDADKSVVSYKKQLNNIPNLNKILTIQNQLKTVSGLHQNKHITSRIYGYLPQITPTTACLNRASIDLTQSTLTLQGTADSLKTVNTYVDTLKFTKYKLSGQDTGKNAFPSVIESQFGLVANQTALCAGKTASASYELTITYDPALFSNAGSIDLEVPAGLATTRSVLDDPSNALFNGPAQTNQTSTGGGPQ
jgi:Tfp pilus assembly protein PilN